MDTPILRSRVEELQSKTSQYNRKGTAVSYFNFDNIVTKYKSKIYLFIPIGIALLLFVFQPKAEVKQDGKVVTKFSWQKFFTYWVILSSAFILTLFVYNYKVNSAS